MKKLPPALAFLIAAALLAAQCDDLTEPVALVPDDLRPAIVTQLAQTVDEDGALTIDVEANDPNGEAMTLSISSSPAHGTATVEDGSTRARRTRVSPPDSVRRLDKRQASALQAQARVLQGRTLPRPATTAAMVGRIRYTPTTDFNGTDRFTFTVRNASGFRSEAEVTVTVEAEPDAPQVVSTIPDQALTIGEAPFSIDLASIFADSDDELLTFTATSSDESIAVAATNGNTLVVAILRTGQARITVAARDPSGLATETHFSVTGVGNRCPVRVGEVGPQELDVNAPPLVVDDLNTLFSDPDGDALTFSAFSTDSSIVTASVEGSRLTVTKVRIGLAAVTVIARDALCAANEPVSFTVTDANAPELIEPITDQVLEIGQAFVIEDLNTVFRNPEGGALSFSAQTNDARVASTSINGSTLTVTARALGQALLTVTASKPDGRSTRDQFVVTIEAGSSPIAVDDQYSVGWGGTLTVDAAQGVLANDADPNGDALSAVLVADVDYGTLTLNADGSFTYTHDGTDVAADAFTYRATDIARRDRHQPRAGGRHLRIAGLYHHALMRTTAPALLLVFLYASCCIPSATARG